MSNFYGILKVLFSCGPAFLVHIATTQMSYSLSNHLYNIEFSANTSDITKLMMYVMLNESGILFLLITIFLFLFLCFPLPIICFTRPKILTKLKMGILVDLFNLLFMLGVDISLHVKSEDLVCMFYRTPYDSPAFSTLLVTIINVVQQTLSAISTILIQISYLEFTCAQSPHSMKGMLIGLSFAIQGLFQLLGTILILPFSLREHSYPSCGFFYYSVNVLLGLFGFVVFVWVAKKYSYRKRDKPSRVHQYAEEYYSNPRVYAAKQQFGASV